ncbi:MAG TPA: hypothetical protein PKH24_05285 [Sedimentisphaerales bacterium]|nr:hypothetical protein [Sedimentisphaerales bacterium]HNU29038.1 hypothetical protein [Sedimentisphaerales bacterium]
MKAAKNSLILAYVIVAICATSNVRADFTFGEPVKVDLSYLGTYDHIECLSYDGLEMYIMTAGPTGQGGADLWVLKRASKDKAWGPPENLGAVVNTASIEECASISADGLTLYFDSNRDHEQHDIYMTTRATPDAPWGPAVSLGSTVNRPNAGDYSPSISADGLELYFSSYRSGGYGRSDLYVSRRATVNHAWGPPTNLGATVNSVSEDIWCSLSPDGLVLFFSDNPFGGDPPRPGGYGNCDMWMTRRASHSKPWQTPVNLGPQLNGTANDLYPRISPDGRTLYFWSNQAGGYCTWQAAVIPVVDFNSDMTVNINDLVLLIDHWGTDDPFYDIGPFAWGDGVVDAADLKVLMEYWGQDLTPPAVEPIAHWRLDETEGLTAHDSVGNKHGTLMGSPVWQPQSGRIDGALAFDGVDDCVAIDRILNPLHGPFSVFAWAKGGGPGEVVVSQQAGANWLMADAEGKLMTQLGATAVGSDLYSQVEIVDGEWHRIGFTWDTSTRRLYADDMLVAADTQTGLASSYGRHYIGCAKDSAAGAFWSGLIDDVRIYDRAMKP